MGSNSVDYAAAVLVTPIYGWGWRDKSNQLLDLPQPFQVQRTNMSDDGWIGIVTNSQHVFAGRTVVLTKRHAVWDGHVNITVAPDIVGFATVSETAPS